MEDFDRQNKLFDFPKGLINAPGMLGFAPDKRKREWWGVLDAFVSNPISYRPRKSAQDPEAFRFHEVGILHNSFPNAGFTRTMKNFKKHWSRADIPIIVSLIEEDANRLSRMIRELEEIENILAIEVIIADDLSSQLISDLLTASLGEIAVISHISVDRAISLADLSMSAGASAISLGPSRKSVRTIEDHLIEAWDYGAANFPRALATCNALANMDIPVIGGGGVHEMNQAKAMLEAGAMAVQLDIVLWKADWDAGKWGT